MFDVLSTPVPMWLFVLFIVSVYFLRWRVNDRTRAQIVEELDALSAKLKAMEKK